MMYDPDEEFIFADHGCLPTISVGDLVILIETEDLMTGYRTYDIEPDNGRGICDSQKYQTYTYHGHIRTVDDTAVRARGLHRVLEIGEWPTDIWTPGTYRNVRVSEDLKEDWE